jgi:hypothetical protein
MKRLALIILLISILVLPLMAACTYGQESAHLGEQFTLYTGKTAVFTGETLRIKFVEVTADNRCPTGVECVRAGEATCSIQISYEDAVSSVNFTQEADNQTNKVNFAEYIISFRLEPYPEYGKEISPEEYRMKMMVIKP